MEKLIKVLKELEIAYFHTPAPANAALPYISYTDYAESYIRADDSIDDIIEHIQLDYFTATEFDPNKRKIRQALDNAGIVFEYHCIYEADEEVYHHIFDCEVI